MTPVLAFDIETIPDVAGIRKLHDLPAELSDAEVAEFAFQKRRAASGNDFLPLHLQRVVVISCALREGDRFSVWSLAEPKLKEAEIIQRFYDGIEKFTPQIVSWNGGGFDLPVLHYRGLIHGVAAPRYWDQGEDDRDFKWNNYISRYHSRHLDLMDLLAMYQPRASAPLDELAKLMGLPGKLGMDGGAVWGAYQAGKHRRDPRLLRDGRREHLPRLPALPAPARGADGEGLRRRGGGGARFAGGPEAAALAGLPRRLGDLTPCR
jgi:predicted PolB exonuclease-like 3'-5' exonuclease